MAREAQDYKRRLEKVRARNAEIEKQEREQQHMARNDVDVGRRPEYVKWAGIPSETLLRWAQEDALEEALLD